MSKDPSDSNLAGLQKSFETGPNGAGGLTLSRHRRRGSDAETFENLAGGAMTPASSIANLALFAEAAELAEKRKGDVSDPEPSLAPVLELPSVPAKNALGEINAMAVGHTAFSSMEEFGARVAAGVVEALSSPGGPT